MIKEVIIKNLRKPAVSSFDQDFNWICDSLAISSGRDKDMVAKKIFEDIVISVAKHRVKTSSDIAKDLNITNFMVNHHIRNLINSGLVCREKRIILLRGNSLKSSLEQIRKDINRIFDELEEVAALIDKRLGIKNRED